MRSTEVVGARLPRSAADEIKQRAAQTGTTPSALVRDALQLWQQVQVVCHRHSVSPAQLIDLVGAPPENLIAGPPTAEQIAHARHEAKWRASQGLPVAADSWIARTLAAAPALPAQRKASAPVAKPAARTSYEQDMRAKFDAAKAKDAADQIVDAEGLDGHERKIAAGMSAPQRARFVELRREARARKAQTTPKRKAP